ncbi:hypothetical protein ACQY0O_005160 [Thecaphora frezii]
MHIKSLFPLALVLLGTSPALCSPLPLASQLSSALGSGGHSTQTQDNDYSGVAPGNSVVNGGGASASNAGYGGSINQASNAAPAAAGFPSFPSGWKRSPGGFQSGSTKGHGGTAYSHQDNDLSGVQDGNEVNVGGGQSVDVGGVAGWLTQNRGAFK